MIADLESLQTAAIERGPYADDCRQVRVALLGCGTVGSAVARLLAESRDRLRESHAIDFTVTRILVRDPLRPREGVDSSLLTSDFVEVLRDHPDVVIEALGGREQALTFVRAALERGISVITANKTLIAHHGPELQIIARRTGAQLAFEASVGAAIPVLASLRQRQGDPLVSLRAVVNGTCNFILSRMRETGLRLNAVLDEAIERGFAEPDPTADIRGRDSAEKLCVLARALGFEHLTPADIPTTGIERITPRDLEAAREQGCVVRLVAEIAVQADGVRASVCPMFVPVTHPLAKARGAENVIVLDQEHGGRLVLQGEGAGPKPTAAAILGDLLSTLDAKPIAPARRSCITPAAASRRSFVRVPRSHEAATISLRQHATHVHLRRDTIEMLVHADQPDIRGGFVAALLE